MAWLSSVNYIEAAFLQLILEAVIYKILQYCSSKVNWIEVFYSNDKCLSCQTIGGVLEVFGVLRMGPGGYVTTPYCDLPPRQAEPPSTREV